MKRYRVARAVGKDRYREVLKEDTELLHLYGLKLVSVDGGLRAAVIKELKRGRINPWDVTEISGKTWEWLRPLLVRLREAEAKLEAQDQNLAAK